jgi:hypothetical protein
VIEKLLDARADSNGSTPSLQSIPETGEPQMQLDELSALLCELERQLHRPEIRASEHEVASLLADEFFEFGASGTVWTRQQVIEDLPRDQQTQPACELGSGDFSVHWLAEAVALVTYRGTRAFHLKQRNSISYAARYGS